MIIQIRKLITQMINKYKFLFILFATLLFLSANASGFTIRTKNNKANKLFYKEEYKKALDLYDELDKRLEKSGVKLNSIVKFNRANTLLKLNNFDEAIKYYNKSRLITEKNLKISDIYYNMGNTSYRAGKLEESIDYYKKTLDINPKDKDAKYNIELIKKKIENQKKEEKENKEDEGNKENEDRKKEKEKTEKDKDQKDKDDEKEQQEEKQKEEQQKEEKKKDEISKEEALRILKALEQRERESRQGEKAKFKGKTGLLKDW
ncbi:tetratricopeptide repeat protein [candidate division WOR-3 bacterium]|nr:tetratricopeptide repeat protein [candidate division WOR-3 bacterium]